MDKDHVLKLIQNKIELFRELSEFYDEGNNEFARGKSYAYAITISELEMLYTRIQER